MAHSELKQSMGVWLDQQVATAPIGDDHPAETIIAWWLGFKRRLTANIKRPNHEAETRRRRPSATVQQLQTAAQEAAAALDAAPHDPGRLTAAVEAQVAVSGAMRADAKSDDLAARRSRISEGERPSRGHTALVHEANGGGDGGGPAPTTLKDSTSGQLVSDPDRVPQIIANYWRDVSALPTETELPMATKQATLAEVMAALRPHPLRLPADPEGDQLGSPEVSSAEVAKALRATPRG
ncbi:hypothetical protein GPECTOR_6g654 [Gonium pectorale]|uniref:Uncharacterized protein n=1 Tax=Gonium pectorale TaxID=33097 RepID=A0A150GV30_GONPE|nr:hypothetical protein GPECTOR_6g654 [Gonium pectorale]|eukprot:KXZ53737.1 hypothetical protein GPECTOR_6g654 [Gonium pectorale]